jgi:hypothetical protein
VSSASHSQPGDALAVEAQDVGKHAPERGAHQIALLAEDSGEAGPGPFQFGRTHADGEGHLGFDAGNVDCREQRGEIRVGALVEDEEAGVDRMRDAIDGDVDGVRMAAEVVGRLVERYLVALRQQPRCRKAGDAGADDGDAARFGLPVHRSSSSSTG